MTSCAVLTGALAISLATLAWIPITAADASCSYDVIAICTEESVSGAECDDRPAGYTAIVVANAHLVGQHDCGRDGNTSQDWLWFSWGYMPLTGWKAQASWEDEANRSYMDADVRTRDFGLAFWWSAESACHIGLALEETPLPPTSQPCPAGARPPDAPRLPWGHLLP